MIKVSPFIESEFHYRLFKSPSVDPAHSAALCIQFPFYTRLHFVERLFTVGCCTLYSIHCTDQWC